jgi:hypothetical protein
LLLPQLEKRTLVKNSASVELLIGVKVRWDLRGKNPWRLHNVVFAVSVVGYKSIRKLDIRGRYKNSLSKYVQYKVAYPRENAAELWFTAGLNL